MKRMLLTGFVLLVFGLAGRAQTIPQLTEQLALDIEKLSHMKALLSDMYTAYAVIDKGYGEVKSIVKGNFDLHKAFLDGLFLVAPEVKRYARVADIISDEVSLVSEVKAAEGRLRASGHFSAAELGYLSSLCGTLLQRGLDHLDELTMLLTDGQLRMSDAERLGAIDRVWTGMSGDLGVLRQVNNTAAVQAGQRQAAGRDIEVLRGIYGIN